jgi:hypothetical protein
MWRDHIENLGFAVIPDVMASDEIEPLVAGICKSSLRRSRAGVRHMLGEPAVAAIAGGARLTAIARKVLGPEAQPYRIFGIASC